MCVAAIAWRAHPRWPLVVIGNRDEYHDRPTAALARWQDGSGIVAGRDLRSGGTWLGVAPARGRFALATNVRNPDGPDPGKASRGALVTDLLRDAGTYRDPASVAPGDFNPFNLLLTSARGLEFLSNRPEPQHRLLPPGIYGLSNGALDEPWPKTLALKSALAAWLDEDREDPAALFAILTADRLPEAGVGPMSEAGKAAPWTTPPFLLDAVYGTRCATVLAIGADGTGTIAERSFDAAGSTTGEITLPITLALARDEAAEACS